MTGDAAGRDAVVRLHVDEIESDEAVAAAIRADRSDLRSVNIHHWQQHNPVTTEALVQLTMGGPPPIYNGGLLHVPVRHFDARAKRPGGADAAAERPRLASARVGRGHRPGREHQIGRAHV